MPRNARKTQVGDPKKIAETLIYQRCFNDKHHRLTCSQSSLLHRPGNTFTREVKIELTWYMN